jgi:hypothetical protein
VIFFNLVEKTRKATNFFIESEENQEKALVKHDFDTTIIREFSY